MGLIEIEKMVKSQVEREETKQNKKQKKFRIPFFKRVKPKQAAKGWTTVFNIHENGFIDIVRKKTSEQTIWVDGVPRLALAEHIMHIKKNPVIFLPTWSVVPIKPEDLANLDKKKHQKEALTNGENTKGYQILLAAMKGSAINNKQPIGGLLLKMIGVVLAIVIGYAFLTGGG